VTTIFLARHGESDWNAERRWQGHADRPLTDRGRAQAAELAARLEEIELEAVYSSDLRRASETAAVVARAHGLYVVELPALREVDVGSWSGLTREEAESRFPEELETWLAGGRGWSDGETYDEMARRVLAAVAHILAEHAGERVLVVSHGGPIRAIHASALGMDVATYRRLKPVVPNARLSAVCAEDARLTRLCAGSEIPELLR
jgi:broad specificity phosphatase PhoE